MTRGKTTTTTERAAEKAARAWVSFVGSGPGDPDLLTVRAVDLIKQADVIVTESPEHGPLVRTLLGLPTPEPVARATTTDDADAEPVEPPGPEIVDGGFGEDGQPLTHAARTKVVVRQAKRGLRVVRLMAGDPFLYASGPEEAQAVAKAGIGFEIVPGVSSVGAVPAYAGIPLTTKDHREVSVVTCGDKVDWQQYADDRTLVLLSAVGMIGDIAKDLIAAGRSPRDPGRDDPGRHHHRAGHGRLDAGAHRRRRPGRPHLAARDHRGRQGRRPPRDAVVVRDQAALRLAGPGAPHQGPGPSLSVRPARLRRRARGGADDLGRAAPQPAADGQGRARPGRGPLRVDRLHLGQRGQGRAREVRGVRPRRPRLLRPEDRRRRRQDRRGHRRLGPARRPDALG